MFILAHSFRGSLYNGKGGVTAGREGMVAGAESSKSHCVSNKEADREQQMGTGYKTSRPTPKRQTSSGNRPLTARGFITFQKLLNFQTYELMEYVSLSKYNTTDTI